MHKYYVIINFNFTELLSNTTELINNSSFFMLISLIIMYLRKVMHSKLRKLEEKKKKQNSKFKKTVNFWSKLETLKTFTTCTNVSRKSLHSNCHDKIALQHEQHEQTYQFHLQFSYIKQQFKKHYHT
jgi:hypothetical protein